MRAEKFFRYGKRETEWLCSRDHILGKFITQKGMIKRRVHDDPFAGLLHTITGQQLSGAAHRSIWERFISAYPSLDPREISDASIENLRRCGLSLAKIGCIREVAAKVAGGSLPLAKMRSWEEGKIAASLLPIKGIGLWTVEMLQIFTFQKKNVLSFGDLALKKGLMKLYGHTKITREIFALYSELYAPYASIAAFYLWEAAGMEKLPETA